jgi:hypothetical protein
MMHLMLNTLAIEGEDGYSKDLLPRLEAGYERFLTNGLLPDGSAFEVSDWIPFSPLCFSSSNFLIRAVWGVDRVMWRSDLVTQQKSRGYNLNWGFLTNTHWRNKALLTLLTQGMGKNSIWAQMLLALRRRGSLLSALTNVQAHAREFYLALTAPHGWTHGSDGGSGAGSFTWDEMDGGNQCESKYADIATLKYLYPEDKRVDFVYQTGMANFSR